MANAERASYGVSVTRDFMGAVGFYRRGGVGRVRFGRIVVREPGDGYCLSAEALEAHWNDRTRGWRCGCTSSWRGRSPTKS